MLKAWMKRFIFKHVFKGISQDTFEDITRLTDAEYQKYCVLGREVWDNPVFRSELARLRYTQERYFVNKAESSDDILFSKAALYTLDLIEKRFEFFNKQVEIIVEDYREAMEEEGTS